MNDDSVMTIAVILPCGCTLRHNFRWPISPETVCFQFTYAAQILAYWVECRTRTHNCTLVSEDNPTGRDPNKE